MVQSKALNRFGVLFIKRFIFSLAFLILLTSCSSEPTPIPDFVTTEEYQVYQDLLLKNPDMWNVPPGAQHMIIFDQSFVRPEPDVVNTLLQFKAGVTELLISNFLEANQIPYFFEDQFNLGIPVTFTSDSSTQNLVRGLQFAEQCQHSIEAIYPRPDYGGFYYLSRVGFDEREKTALLYIEQSICGGNGGFLIFKKETEAWKIMDFVTALNSDLGLYLSDELSEEEHAVHNAVLNAIDPFLSGNNYQYLTVFDQTGISDQLFLDGSNLLSAINTGLPDVSVELMDNLLHQNSEPLYLAPRFSTERPVVLVSWQEYWQLSQMQDEIACFATLQERFPDPTFQGWLRLSRVGFNQENNKALVYLDSFKCKSEDFLLYLEKQEGVWKMVDFITLSSLPTSPHFGRILFETNRDGNQEIYMINSNGSDPTNLTNNPAIDFSPTWSPDRNSIAYNSGINGNAEIFIFDLEGMQSINVTNYPAKDWEPDWSPDGSQIVFFTDRDRFSEIYTLLLDTLAIQRLTTSDFYERQPVWSPDGNQIAYSSDQDGDWEIYLMDKDGRNVINLTNNEVFDLGPSWSPDGSMLTFASKLGDNWELFSMDISNQKVTRLTDNPANDLNPVWSPDGKKIAFQSNRDGNLEIYIMNADGSEQVNITNHPANDYNPDW
jgi:Tol biopolymer transport system component